jgi:hypothetical protein
VTYRDWASLDGTYTATLAVGSAADRVQVMFFRGNDDATELAGQSVVLGGVSGVVDPQASAYFAVRELREARSAGRPDALFVAGTAWRLVSTETTK